MYNSTYDGIYSVGSTNISVYNNIIKDNQKYGFYNKGLSEKGLSEKLNVKENIIENNLKGIMIRNSNGSNIINNTITNKKKEFTY